MSVEQTFFNLQKMETVPVLPKEERKKSIEDDIGEEIQTYLIQNI